MNGTFARRTAIVTGAASGVGAAVTTRLLREGATVVGVDVRPSSFRSERWQFVRADVTDVETADRVVEEAIAGCGHLDVLVNNAGITVREPLNQTTDQVWQQVLDINLTSAFRFARAAAPHLARSTGAAIVNVASINALRGNHNVAAYSAAKGGMVAITRALAMELADQGIRVNAVCPGALDTPMTHEYLAGADPQGTLLSELEAKHPLRRLGRAEEIASAIAWLASDDAAWITGVALPVDGGRHLGR